MEKIYPLVTVGVMIFSPRKYILLVKSHKWNNLYSLPGGKVEWGETCVDAIRREAKEETGLDIENIQFAIWQEAIFSNEFWKKMHFVMHDYTATLAKGYKEEDVVLNDEGQEFIWVDPKNALTLPLITYGKVFLEWYLKKSQ